MNNTHNVRILCLTLLLLIIQLTTNDQFLLNTDLLTIGFGLHLCYKSVKTVFKLTFSAVE